MSRCYVVTGAASGMGKAIADLLASRGDRVVRSDLREGDLTADLSDASARRELIARIGDFTDGRVDGLALCAGIAQFIPATVSINYFGVVDLLDGLRPLLAKSDAPRAAVISSLGSTFGSDEALVAACLAGD